MRTLPQDLLYAARSLRSSLGFVLVAALTLALGLGANIAVFSVVDALLLRPYALPDLDRLVLVREGRQAPGENRFTPADYADLEREARIFDRLAAFRFQEFSLGGRSVYLVARTLSDPAGIVCVTRGLVQSIDAELAVTDVQSLDGVIADLKVPVRVIGGLMLVFGAIALALSAVGVYGVLPYGVARRTREFGMRMALGARPADLMRLVIGQALRLSGVGLVVALPIAIAITHAMASILFGLALLSAVSVGGFAALFVLVAIAAGYVPAWRAMRVGPVVALRNE